MSYTLTKAQITHIKQLQENKYRKEFGLFIAEGEKILQELLKIPDLVETIYSTQELPMPHELISETQMQKISALQTPTNILVVAKQPKPELQINPESFYLILDGIQDPGNMGTMVRIADWYGISDLICSAESADAYSPKAVQASMGSIARVCVHKLDVVSFLTQHGYMESFVAMLAGQNVTKLATPKSGFIVVGSEGKGVSAPVLQLCKNRITIPGAGFGESLNASVACGIICSHLIKW